MSGIGRWAMLIAAASFSSPLVAAKLPSRLGAMTADAFAAAVEEQTDAAGRVILSTHTAFHPKPLSPIRHLLTDNHLRAVIDPASGSVRYELHQSIFYWGERRSFLSARLQAPAGVRQAALLSARHGERFCPNEDNWGHCALTKQVVFAIEEHELRAIASQDAPWRYRIDEASGRHWDGLLSPAEAAGLLAIAERRLETLRSPSGVVANP